MNILIVKFGALGDVVRTSYIVNGLIEKYGNTKIFWLTAESSFDLLRFHSGIDVLVTPTFNFDKLTSVDFDLIISLDDEYEVVRLLKDFSYTRILGAYLDCDQVLYTESASDWFDMGLLSKLGKDKADLLKKQNQLEHNEIFSKMLDVDVENVFYGSIKHEEKFADVVDKKRFNLGINSGSGGRWESKKLPIDRVVALVNLLLDMNTILGKDVAIYLLGGYDEQARNEEIKSYFLQDSRVLFLGSDFSILEFSALIKNMDYLITSDSLALHLSIAQKVPNLSFYAPTSAAEIGTFGTGVKVVSTANDYCSYKRDADNSTITAKRIFEAFKEHVGV